MPAATGTTTTMCQATFALRAAAAAFLTGMDVVFRIAKAVAFPTTMHAAFRIAMVVASLIMTLAASPTTNHAALVAQCPTRSASLSLLWEHCLGHERWCFVQDAGYICIICGDTYTWHRAAVYRPIYDIHNEQLWHHDHCSG